MRVIEPEVELDAELEHDNENELLPVLQPSQNPYEAPLK